MKKLNLFSILILFFINTAFAADINTLLDEAISGQHRSPENVARDVYRHPKETLLFFGLQPDMKVLEILPGRGWYTEILAPVLKDNGELTIASFGADHPTEYLANIHVEYMKLLDANPDMYGQVKRILFKKESYLEDIPDNTLDMVVTFRNTHNWIRYGGIEDIYAAFYRVLKPGGILGVVQHRADKGADANQTAENGYVPETTIIKLAESLGFELVDKSEINANPKDTKDYPAGVWTLPPTYRMGDLDKDKYTAIGESDRMTLKFIKL